MKSTFLLLITIILLGFKANAQFTFTNNEAKTNNEIVAPVLRLSNEFRLPNTFAANDPTIGTLDNTGFGINIHKTEGIGFTFNNVHRVFFKPDGNIRTSNSNPSLHIEGTGTGNYHGATLIMSAKGVTTGNKHVSTWFMTHRGTNGIAAIELQRRGRNNEYNGSLLTYRDSDGWKFAVANNATSGIINAFNILNSGKIGIGTTSPNSRLTVFGDSGIELRKTNNTDQFMKIKPMIDVTSLSPGGSSAAAQITNLNLQHLVLDITANDQGDSFAIRTDSNLDGAVDKIAMVVKPTGNIGIGTTTPQAKLEINSQTIGDAVLRIEADVNNSNESNNARVELYQDGALHGAFIGFDNAWGGTTPDNIFRIVTRSSGVNDYSNFTINPSTSNVGIGTSRPDAKLTVNGDIHTAEVRVDLAIPAPDYVFKDSYDLLTIAEVQAHIQEKGHLPNIPSAKEMESNGVELGNMNMKLLEKIEELTLYTIAQEKQLKIQQQKNNELETRLAKLEKLLTK